jgi:hypothetical protein
MVQFYTSIYTNWWLFLVVFGVIFIFCSLGCVIELLRKNEDTLSKNPILIFLKLFILLVFFYGMYSMIIFSIDTLFKEQFTFTQIFNDAEFTFTTNRGIMTTIALGFAMISTCSILLTLVDEHNLIRDYSFTLGFVHFCVVCIVTLDFPISYAWWIALIVGGISLDLLCELSLYQFNTMPYKSHMAGDQKSKKVKSPVSSTQQLATMTESTFITNNNMSEEKLDKTQKKASISPNKIHDISTIIVPEQSWTQPANPLVELDDIMLVPKQSKKNISVKSSKKVLTHQRSQSSGIMISPETDITFATQESTSQVSPRRTMSMMVSKSTTHE